MKRLIDHLIAIVSTLLPGPVVLAAFPAPGSPTHRGACAGYGAWRHPEAIANSGGPRSRVVSTPIVSRVLSKGSKTLGFTPLTHYEMIPRHDQGGFRKIALRLLRKAGFTSPEEAWEVLRGELPDQPSLVVDAQSKIAPDIAVDPSRQSLIAALVLGRCCGSLFSPRRPIIWSERRLARSVRLVHCDAETFTRDDDE
jgi:hypothetical protein